MKTFKKITYLWGPVLAWMGLIFFFSSRPRVSVSEEEVVNFVFFKSLHMIEYGILFFLLFRATLHKNTKHNLIYAFLIAVLYGISDEIHQTFIPTREGKLRDVFIDTLGIAIMYMYTKRRSVLFKKA